MADVFISYASEDRERASRLASALEARGWSVWWDRKIVAGETFDQVIERELDAARSVIVLWSKDSIGSEWVKNEASRAVERGVLVPAIIENVRPPLEFRRKQTADLVGWNGDPKHGGLLSLCDGVAASAGRKSPPQTADPVPSAVQPRWRHKWIIVVCLIVLAIGLTAYWRSMRSTELPTVEKPGEFAALADSVVGTYFGNVVSDSQGSSQSDVTVVISKVSARRVKVTSDYARLGTVEVDLTRAGSTVLSSSGAVVLSIDLAERPPRISYNPGGVAYFGTKR